MHVAAIIPAGGRGTRFGAPLPKQLTLLAGRPILQRTIDAFVLHDRISEIVVALPSDVADGAPEYLHDGRKRVKVVPGGERRQDSVARALAQVAESADIVVVHDAVRPLVSADLISRTIDAAAADGAAIAALAATDTVKTADDRLFIRDTLPRERVFLAQTPQAFRASLLRSALAGAAAGSDATDEAVLVERAGHRVRLVAGDPVNMKITTPADLALAEALLGTRPGGGLPALRIGNGYDLHRLVPGRRLVLGGVEIPFEKGLVGHSDADAVCHAITDALFGACGAGDIGRHFPDTDPAWKDADSLALLSKAAGVAAAAGYAVINVDVVVIAERPKMAPYADAMRANLARAMGVGPDRVSIKGKTNEGTGSIGAGESIAVHAVALLAAAGPGR